MDIEEKLKESVKNYKILNNEFETFLDLIPGILFCKDRNDVVTRVNQNFAKLLNSKKEDIIGKTTFDLFPKVQAENFRKDDLEVINTGKPKINIEEVAEFPDKKVWSATSKVPYYNDKGEINGIIGLAIDITERKIAEQKLKESEEKWRALSENSPAVILLCDREHKILFANRTTHDFSKEEIIGTLVYNYVPQEWRQIDIECRNSVWETGEPVRFSTNYITKEGEVRYFDIWMGPIFQAGKVIALVSHHMDVTEHHKLQISLQESEKRLLHVQEIGGLGFWDWNLKTNELYWSDETFRIYGFNPQEFVPTYEKFSSIVHPEDLDDVQNRVDSALQNGTKYSIDFRILRANGEIGYISVESDTIFDEKGKAIRLVGTQIDITERKKAEQKLEDSEKHLRELNDELERKVIDRTEALKNSEQKYKTILDGIVTGVWVADKGDNIYYVNRSMGKIAGVPSEQLVNANVLKDFSESTLKNFRPYYLKAKNTLKEVYYDSVPVITPAGRQSFQSGWLIPLTKDGKFYSTICTVEDITERKKTKQNLKESEKKLRNLNKELEQKVEERTKKLQESEKNYRELLENMMEGYYALDLKGNFTFANEYFCKTVGYSKEELIGKSYRLIYDEKSSKNLFKMFNQVYRSGIPLPHTNRGEGLTNKGKQVFFEGIIDLIYDSEGNKTGFYGFARDITEKIKAEQKLRESEEILRSTLESTAEINIELSVLNKIITLGNESTSLQEFLEKSYDQVLEVVNFDRGGVYLYDPETHHNKLVLHKNIDPDFIAAVEDVDMAGEPFNVVFDKINPYYIEDFSEFMEGSKDLGIYSAAIVPLRSKDEYIGSLNVGSHKYQMLSQKDLKILVAIGKQMGIIIQKFESEKLLKESEQQLTSFMNSATDGFIIYDSQLNYVDVNNVAIQTIGMTKEEIIGKNILDIVPTLKETGRYDKYMKVIKTGEPFSTEDGIFNRIDGSMSSDLSIRAFKVGDNLGVIFTDITERKEKEKEIFDLAQFPSENPYSVLRVNKNGVMYVNEAGKKLLNLDDNSQIPKIFQRDVKEAFENNQKTITEVELDERVYSFIITPIKDTDYVNIYGMDITERKQVEVKLRELNNLKTDFLRRASHELKTPLITIKGFSELILSVHKDQLDPSINAKLREINTGCERLQKIIENLLKTSRLESPELRPSKHREDLSFLINVCVHELEPMAERRRQSIILDIYDQLHITIEKEEIHDVLSNLLSNAIKYTPPMGKIYIRTELKEDFVVVSVRDNGIGFTDEQKQLIFQQFGKIERYGQGLDLGIDGTGLGLYISKKIVESHGGKIWMESEGKNKGSTFYFSLPKIIKE